MNNASDQWQSRRLVRPAAENHPSGWGFAIMAPFQQDESDRGEGQDVASDGSPGSDSSAAAVPTTDYDLLPYLAMPISYTEPSRLAAIGRLLGLRCPDPDTASVVEFGCADGGNLIPMAVRRPGARFLGLDLSARQVEAGQARIRQLGLANIELRRADLGAIDLPQASADYVICHGVFSWVPRPVQEAILRQAGRALTDQGVAAVSYNVLPGWHLRQPVRDVLLQAAGADGTPQERVARARAALQRLARDTAQRQGYGAVMRAEAVRMARMPASYLMGEFLADHNIPVSFQDFVARAAAHGLSYLAEADLSAAACELVARRARPTLRDLTGPDRIAPETQLDLIGGRPFRRTLLALADVAASAGPPRHSTLQGLHVAAPLTRDDEHAAKQGLVFRDGAGRVVSASDPAVADVLARLSDAWPGTCAVAGLTEGPDGRRFARILLDLVATGRAVLHACPLRVGRASARRPKLWAMAQAQARAGQPSVTGLNHGTVILEADERVIAARLDGSRTRDELLAWLDAEHTGGDRARSESRLASALLVLERGATLSED